MMKSCVSIYTFLASRFTSDFLESGFNIWFLYQLNFKFGFKFKPDLSSKVKTDFKLYAKEPLFFE